VLDEEWSAGWRKKSYVAVVEEGGVEGMASEG
jgi:hypothetical protein